MVYYCVDNDKKIIGGPIRIFKCEVEILLCLSFLLFLLYCETIVIKRVTRLSRYSNYLFKNISF